MQPVQIFVGYDPREAVAYHVCCNSIIRHATMPVSITPLALNTLAGVYCESHPDGSNAFIYSRFLVPYLTGYSGQAIFLDGDMVVRDDITQILDYLTPGLDVAVAKHEYRTKHPVKYLGAKNDNYPKKNWSSVIAWNCYTCPSQKLTPEYVQNSTGAHLHRFDWTSPDRVGDLPLEWNWLVSEYEYNSYAKLYHYTIGTPCFKAYSSCENSEEWHNEFVLSTEVLE
jgi:hypothetical protein